MLSIRFVGSNIRSNSIKPSCARLEYRTCVRWTPYTRRTTSDNVRIAKVDVYWGISRFFDLLISCSRWTSLPTRVCVYLFYFCFRWAYFSYLPPKFSAMKTWTFPSPGKLSRKDIPSIVCCERKFWWKVQLSLSQGVIRTPKDVHPKDRL